MPRARLTARFRPAGSTRFYAVRGPALPMELRDLADLRKSGKAASPSIWDVLSPPPGMTVALYRRFDADDLLLYIGITGDLRTRQASHRRGSSWSMFAVRQEVEWFPDEISAKVAEKAAIEAERPLFNLVHNATPEAKARLVAYLVEKGRLDLLAPAVSRG